MPSAGRIFVIWLTSLRFAVASINQDACPHHLRGPGGKKILLWGETGAGKSTTTNKLTHGFRFQNVDRVGYTTQSTTVDTNGYLIPVVNTSACSLVIDIPGVKDTEHRDQQFQTWLFGNITTLADSIDVILVIFKHYDKLTDDAYEVFKFLRSSFPPRAWRNIVVVYNWWQWNDCPLTLLGMPAMNPLPPVQRQMMNQGCQNETDLAQYHHDVWNGAFQYMSAQLGSGDRQCAGADDTDCIPTYDQIPYFGLQNRLDKEWDASTSLANMYGIDLLDPKPYADWSCCGDGPNEPKELLRLAHQLDTMQTTPINTSSIVNYWLECQHASTAVQNMLNADMQDMPPLSDVLHVKNCIDGHIREDMEPMVTTLRDAHSSIQVKFAFPIGDKSYISQDHGFSKVHPSMLDGYPDAATYLACTAPPTTSEHSPNQHLCWDNLQAHPELPEQRTSLAALMDIVLCSCQGGTSSANAFRCSLSNLGHACSDASCFYLDTNWQYLDRSSVCCGSNAICQAPGWEVDAEQSKNQCTGNCSHSQCCTKVCESPGTYLASPGSCRRCAGQTSRRRHATSCDPCMSSHFHPDNPPSDNCQLKICTCEHGTHAVGDACPVNGTQVCSDCEDGYAKKGQSCVEKVCTCSTGTAPRGASCPSDGLEYCTRCNSGYHLVGHTCIPWGCNLPQGCGACVDQSDRTSDADCGRCNSGWRSHGHECVSASCPCDHGTGATGDACPVSGAAACGSCDHGYDLAHDKTCTLRVCSCQHGTPAQGDACPTAGSHVCNECDDGYHLDSSNGCVPYQCNLGDTEHCVGCVSQDQRQSDSDCNACEPGWVVRGKMCVWGRECLCHHGQKTYHSYRYSHDCYYNLFNTYKCYHSYASDWATYVTQTVHQPLDAGSQCTSTDYAPDNTNFGSTHIVVGDHIYRTLGERHIAETDRRGNCESNWMSLPDGWSIQYDMNEDDRRTIGHFSWFSDMNWIGNSGKSQGTNIILDDSEHRYRLSFCSDSTGWNLLLRKRCVGEICPSSYTYCEPHQLPVVLGEELLPSTELEGRTAGWQGLVAGLCSIALGAFVYLKRSRSARPELTLPLMQS